MKRQNVSIRLINIFLVLCFAVCVFSADVFAQRVPEILPEIFSKMIRDMSEEGGYFPSDNWVTNEMSYLEVIDQFADLGVKGGAYLGVAAAQNFSYIAEIKPEIVFFVDIRPQNRIQHLAYKIIFELSETRTEFLSYLFSKPIHQDSLPPFNANIEDLVYFFYDRPSDPVMKENTINQIIDILKNKYRYILGERDISTLRFVMDSFYRYHLDIRYASTGRMMFPTFAEVLTARDLNGKMRNVFNSIEGYNYIRTMEIENRVIPLTGDFGGNHALSKVAEYLNKYNIPLSAYYVSNVEEYVIKDRYAWNNWVKNLSNMPLTDNTVIIRWTHEYGLYHQDTRLQYAKRFAELDSDGEYRFYSDLIYTEYIEY